MPCIGHHCQYIKLKADALEEVGLDGVEYLEERVAEDREERTSELGMQGSWSWGGESSFGGPISETKGALLSEVRRRKSTAFPILTLLVFLKARTLLLLEYPHPWRAFLQVTDGVGLQGERELEQPWIFVDCFDGEPNRRELSLAVMYYIDKNMYGPISAALEGAGASDRPLS